MKGETIAIISVLIVAAFSAVSDALAIGFEVDTPLDPFLGGLSKIKRQIVRRVKELGTDDSFVNASPMDQLNMLFAQPQTTPINLPQFTFPTQTSQQPITTQFPPATIDQRKLGGNQIPPPIAQAMDAQLMSFLNQGMGRRSFPFTSLPGLRQVPGILQQMSQTLPFRSFNPCPVPQQGQAFF